MNEEPLNNAAEYGSAPSPCDWEKLAKEEVDGTRTLAAHLEARSPSLLSWLLAPRLLGTQFRLSTFFWAMLFMAWWLFCIRSLRDHAEFFLISYFVMIVGSIVVLKSSNASRGERIGAWIVMVVFFLLPCVAGALL
jgi:hypothetical protein